MSGHDLCEPPSLKGQETMQPSSAGKVSTIGDAQEWYLRSDGVVRSSALREIINHMVEGQVKTEFENDSYLDALVLTEVMFARANNSIRMFTGPMCEGFLKTLESCFKSAVERFALSGGIIQIVIICDEVPKFLADLKEKFPKTIQIGLAKIRPGAGPINHFLVCDSKMARVEEPHGDLTQNTPIDAIKAKAYFNNVSLARIFESRFAAMWGVVYK